MFKEIARYWHWYSSLGVMPHHDEIHRRKVRFANRFLSFCILLIILLGISEILTSKYWVLPMHIARIFGLAVAISQLYKDRYSTSIYIALYSIFIFSIVGTIISPIRNSFHFVAFPLCSISFYLTEGRRGNILFVFFNLIYFTLADYYNEYYLPADYSVSHIVSVVIVFIVFYITVSIYIWESRFFEKIIAKKNHNLKQQNETLEIQNKQMLELNDLKNNVFSILGHDLRSPFNNIIGFSGLLQRNFKTNTEQKNEHLIDLLNDSVQQTSQLIDDLLYWGRCQSNRIEIKNERILISPLYQDLCALYQNTINNKGVFVQIGNIETKECQTDRTILATIVRNLFSNAIKYTPKNGSITLSSKSINNSIVLLITDTGFGMSSDKILLLENALNKESRQGTNNEAGFGFGMTICVELAQKIDAKISFESETDKGTTAKIHLPHSASII